MIYTLYLTTYQNVFFFVFNFQITNEMYQFDGKNWEDLPTKFVHPIQKGQSIRHTTAGGGGYGPAHQRSPAQVLNDVHNGKVTVKAAARDYGVAIIGPPWRLDLTKTNALRNVDHE